MVLKLKLCTLLHPLTFSRPINVTGGHGVRMFV